VGQDQLAGCQGKLVASQEELKRDMGASQKQLRQEINKCNQGWPEKIQ
jgi:hypothetical protein